MESNKARGCFSTSRGRRTGSAGLQAQRPLGGGGSAVQYAKRQAWGLTLAYLCHKKVGDLQGTLHGLRE